MLNYIQTEGGLHIVLQGKPVTLHKSDKNYPLVIEAIKAKKTEQELVDILEAERRRIEEAVTVAEGIEMKGGQLYYQGDVIAGVLGERMLQMVNEGFDLTPMAAFLANLMQNPSYRVVNHLYAFLEQGKNPITPDGHFLAYKAVRQDFTDIRTGTFDNSIGKLVAMSRNKVDEDPERTCSYGLHVCSFDYLPHFSHADGHVIVCKVNPADVVAIPADYNNTKMRVCKYEVVGEHEGYYTGKGDVLSNTSVSEVGTTGRTFEVFVAKDSSLNWELVDGYDRLAEGAEAMESELDDSDNFAVKLVNTSTGTVIDQKENENYDHGFGGDDDDKYFVFRSYEGGAFEQVADDFDTVADAASWALEQDDDARYEVRDANGTVMKTIS